MGHRMQYLGYRIHYLGHIIQYLEHGFNICDMDSIYGIWIQYIWDMDAISGTQDSISGTWDSISGTCDSIYFLDMFQSVKSKGEIRKLCCIYINTSTYKKKAITNPSGVTPKEKEKHKKHILTCIGF